jgi:hypothetical protein
MEALIFNHLLLFQFSLLRIYLFRCQRYNSYRSSIHLKGTSICHSTMHNSPIIPP